MTDRGKVLRALKQHLLAPDVDECEACPYGELSGLECVRQLYRDVVELINEQDKIIEQYHKADSFLAAHGWKWESEVI